MKPLATTTILPSGPLFQCMSIYVVVTNFATFTGTCPGAGGRVGFPLGSSPTIPIQLRNTKPIHRLYRQRRNNRKQRRKHTTNTRRRSNTLPHHAPYELQLHTKQPYKRLRRHSTTRQRPCLLYTIRRKRSPNDEWETRMEKGGEAPKQVSKDSFITCSTFSSFLDVSGSNVGSILAVIDVSSDFTRSSKRGHSLTHSAAIYE